MGQNWRWILFSQAEKWLVPQNLFLHSNLWNLWILPYLSPKKGVFENITMLKILTWRDCPGLSGSALDAITCVFMKGRQRNIRYSQRKEWQKDGEDSDLKVTWKLEWCGHNPRNTCNHHKLKEARSKFSPSISWQHPDFRQVIMTSDFRPPQL